MVKKIVGAFVVVAVLIFVCYGVTVATALLFPTASMYPVNCMAIGDSDENGSTKGITVECYQDFYLFEVEQDKMYIKNGDPGVNGDNHIILWLYHWGAQGKLYGATMAEEGDNQWWNDNDEGIGAITVGNYDLLNSNKFVMKCYQDGEVWDIQYLPSGTYGCVTRTPAMEKGKFGIKVSHKY